MSKHQDNKQVPLDFWMSYSVEEMHSLPDPFEKPVVIEGVNIKIALGNMWGGWELTKDGPKVVWFLFVQNRKVERLNSAI